MDQAEYLYEQARWLLKGEFFTGVCFHCQQASEMAVKAIYQSRRVEAWGHMITKLLNDLPSEIDVPEDVTLAAARLDQFYIPTRYPNGFTSGAPKDYFMETDAQHAIHHCQVVMSFCREVLNG